MAEKTARDREKGSLTAPCRLLTAATKLAILAGLMSLRINVLDLARSSSRPCCGITLDPGLMLRRHELGGVRKPYSSRRQLASGSLLATIRQGAISSRRAGLALRSIRLRLSASDLCDQASKGWIRRTTSRPTRPTSISIVMAGQMAHSNNIPPMLRAVLRVRKSHCNGLVLPSRCSRILRFLIAGKP